MKTLSWNEFTANVQQWATERGIYEHSTPEAQLLKALSELGELSDAVIKNDSDGLKDAIGDVAVCMVNYGAMADCDVDPTGQTSGSDSDSEAIGFIALYIGDLLCNIYCDAEPKNIPITLVEIASRNGLDFMDCCTQAWETIKDRKGRMVAGGAFVKDEE